jgi:hypothetical protein
MQIVATRNITHSLDGTWWSTMQRPLVMAEHSSICVLANVVVLEARGFESHEVVEIDTRQLDEVLYVRDKDGQVRAMRLHGQGAHGHFDATFTVTAADDLSDVLDAIGEYAGRLSECRFWDGVGTAHI